MIKNRKEFFQRPFVENYEAKQASHLCFYEAKQASHLCFYDERTFAVDVYTEMERSFRETMKKLDGYDKAHGIEEDISYIGPWESAHERRLKKELNKIKEMHPQLGAALNFVDELSKMTYKYFHGKSGYEKFYIAAEALCLANEVLENPSKESADALKRFAKSHDSLSFGDILKGSILAFLGVIFSATLILAPAGYYCFKGASTFFKTPIQDATNKLLKNIDIKEENNDFLTNENILYNASY